MTPRSFSNGPVSVAVMVLACVLVLAWPSGCLSQPAYDCYEAFTNTYVSDGQYISRTVGTYSSAVACLAACYANSACVAAYYYDPYQECSLIPAGYVGTLYGNYGTMTNYSPNSRHALVLIGRAVSSGVYQSISGATFVTDAAGCTLP